MENNGFGEDFDLHNAILNLQSNPVKYDSDPNLRLAYKEGHREARHDAAGLAGDYVASHASRDALRLDAFIQWFINSRSRSEICPTEHMRPATREEVLSWLDIQIAPAKNEEVVEIVTLLNEFCKEAKLANLANGQVYKTGLRLVETYMSTTFTGNPIPRLIQALGDFLQLARTFRMEETLTVAKARALYAAYRPATA